MVWLMNLEVSTRIAYNRGSYLHSVIDLAEISTSFRSTPKSSKISTCRCYFIFSATLATIEMGKRQCAIMSHLKVAYELVLVSSEAVATMVSNNQGARMVGFEI